MPELKSKFLGVILGCAVGDALGAPYEGWQGGSLPSSEKLLSGYAPIPGYPLGQYTDDTQLTLAIAEAIIEKDSVNADEIARRFVRLWESGEIVGQGASCTEGVINLIGGIPPDRSGTGEGRAGNGCAMRAGPIGLWFHRDPQGLFEASRLHSVITHRDPRAIAGAAAVACAVSIGVAQEKISEEAFLGEVAETSGILSPEFRKYILEIPRWLKGREEDALVEISSAGWIDPPRPVGGITPFVIPTVLVALYYFLKTPGEWGTCVARTIQAGGDVDTTGAIAGAIAGACNGVEAIPSHLLTSLKDGDMIRKTAEKLYEKYQSVCL